MKHETMQEAARAAPPLGATGLTLWGVPLNEVLILLTIVYTLFLLVDKFPRVVERVRSAWLWLKEKYDKESN
jgi:hypothetical protein